MGEDVLVGLVFGCPRPISILYSGKDYVRDMTLWLKPVISLVVFDEASGEKPFLHQVWCGCYSMAGLTRGCGRQYDSLVLIDQIEYG